ncbi:hypothetical protein N7444_001791 [Penicillium canescens]|nr:hypothetical protein N7444_001791 [Penicillium canescens]
MKNRIRHPSQQRRAAGRAATEVTTVNRLRKAKKHTSRSRQQTDLSERRTGYTIFCTIACTRGMEFARRLQRQFARNRKHGFEQLHVCGRTGYLIKATLLLHGYTVIIKATTADKQHLIQADADNYGYLRSPQGKHIPVCLGAFTPRVSCWYHGELMEQMMILSWSGSRLQHVINDDNSSFHKECEKALAVLRSHGVVHGDSEWRNMLWDDLGGRLIVIDLEDVKWVKRPRALEPTSGNTRHGHRVGGGKSRQRLLSSSTAVCT